MTKSELVKIIKEELAEITARPRDYGGSITNTNKKGSPKYWQRVLGNLGGPELIKAVKDSGINMNQWAEFMKASNSRYARPTGKKTLGQIFGAARFAGSDPELKGMWKQFNKHAGEINFLKRNIIPHPISRQEKQSNAKVQKLIKQHTKEIKHVLTKNKKVSQIMKGIRTRFSGSVSIAPKSKAGQLTIADVSDEKALATINKKATDSKFKKLLKKMPVVGRFLVVAGLVAGAEDAYAKGGTSGFASFVGKSGLQMTPILGDIISAVELARIAGAPASAMDPAPGLKPGLKL
tara:strand:+ start:3996 stop:4871 length:876 start_codon:yes stop_codon:yes gene_type:complete